MVVVVLVICVFVVVGAQGETSNTALGLHSNSTDSHTVELRLGQSMDINDIKKGDFIFLECRDTANPRPTRIEWRKDGTLLTHDLQQGIIIIHNQFLLIQDVSRHSSGNYTCHTFNSVGMSTSNVLPITVNYLPVCSDGQVAVYSVALHESVRVTCSVDAQPATLLEVQWILKTKEGEMLKVDGKVSILDYNPRTALDYGTLMCRTRNRLGFQVTPCQYQIVPAGRPDSPEDCQVIPPPNTTTSAAPSYNTLRIECRPGFDGGLAQEFTAVVAESGSNYILQNVTNPVVPVFVVAHGLQADTLYSITIFAANAKGRSGSVVLAASTQPAPPVRAGTAAALPLDGFTAANLRTKLTATKVIGVLIGVLIHVSIILFS